MKKSLVALALATALLAATSAHAADVGVSINISQPGVFGRIDIGRFPQPELVVAQPVIIGRPVPQAQPVYMWVPPAHRADWKHHCREYHACGVPVYFVRDEWYGQHVRPHEHDRDHDRGHDRREERRDDRRDDHRGDRRD